MEFRFLQIYLCIYLCIYPSIYHLPIYTLYKWVCLSEYPCFIQKPMETRRGVRSLGTGIPEITSYHVRIGIQTWLFWKNCRHSSSLKHFCSLKCSCSLKHIVLNSWQWIGIEYNKILTIYQNLTNTIYIHYNLTKWVHRIEYRLMQYSAWNTIRNTSRYIVNHCMLWLVLF